MIAWRIATEGKTFKANDTFGEGARRDGGRWNPEGVPLLYAAESRALACLETIGGLAEDLPTNKYLVRLVIPDEIWRERTRLDPNRHPGWDAIPAGATSIEWGARWIREQGSLVAQVPSVVVPEESNILINPGHPAIAGVEATTIRKWVYDVRLRIRSPS